MARLAFFLCVLRAARAATSAGTCEDTPSSSWLQVALRVSEDNEPSISRQEESLRSALPLAWMHIPKAGTSFLNALIHLPDACPGIPTDLSVDEDHFGEHFEAGFFGTTCIESCPGIDCHTPGMHHLPIGSQYDSVYRGHGAAMFRQPAQRIISHYDMKTQPESGHYAPEFTETITLPAYAKLKEGCVTQMLAQSVNVQPCVGKYDMGSVTREELALAKQRLREGFVFVGITEQWDLSICLLHAMFGGQCYGVEFQNSRPGVVASEDLYDESGLEGFVDFADGEIYKEALDIFNANLERYNVSRESCGPCWEQAAGTMPSQND